MASSLMSVRVDDQGQAQIKLTKRSQAMLSNTYKLLKALSLYDPAAKEAAEKMLTVAAKHQE